MKLKYFFILFVAVGFMTFRESISAAAQDANVQTINVCLPSPFNSLSIPLDWKEEDICEDSHICQLDFENINNEDVDLFILAGKPLKEDASIEALETQITKFIQKEAKTIPIFKQSYNIDCDDSMINLKERRTFGEFEWLQFITEGEIEITHIENDLEITVVIKTFDLAYATFVNNRLVLIGFSAPQDVFNDYLPLFEETMHLISQY